jgi:hypothetical protein
MKQIIYILVGFLLLLCSFCNQGDHMPNKSNQPVYKDVPYLQDYAVKFFIHENEIELKKVYADRNGVIEVLTINGLFRPINGHFQYPGTLLPDKTYRPMADKHIADMVIYKNQFVFLDDKAVFSNAWAGKLYSLHPLSEAKIICGGPDFTFMISDGNRLCYVKDTEQLWCGNFNGDSVLSIKYFETSGNFLILGKKGLYSFSVQGQILNSLYQGDGLSCFTINCNDSSLIIGTMNGYFVLEPSGKQKGEIYKKLPWPELTSVEEIEGKLWFGSTKGAFMLREDGKFNYYYGERWLPGNEVKHISPGPDNSVLILTNQGLGQICFRELTLEDKANIFEKQVHQRHIRYGMNSTESKLQNHDLSTAQNQVADSDNLWTGMYLGSQLFRYLVTGSDDAKQNCYEAFEAMERMHEINGIKGLFGRSFERRGYQEFRPEFRSYVDDYWYKGYQGTVSWRNSEDPEWDWRASASSDQTVGQIFALTLVAEYIEDESWKNRAIKLLDELMTYIVENDLCLIDYNDIPTLWGRWHPQYVNRFDTMVGDRKICSSNIIAFLQTAYRFTGKELFKNKAFELMNTHGYLDNLTRPFSEIGPAPESADNWSKMLSEEWNHSDDALWNFCYAMTGATEFDLEESIWYLKEFPLDLIQFAIQNSHRQDIEMVEPNFRGQTTAEVLPPDERPELKHNRNFFTLDAGDRSSELSAGDTFLLPYWMGRYLGIISPPQRDEETKRL